MEKKKKFPGCPSLSYQSVICARRPPSSAAILRQHPGPQDAAENTAGHQERCDNVTGYSRRRSLNASVCMSQTHTRTQWPHNGYTFSHTNTTHFEGRNKDVQFGFFSTVNEHALAKTTRGQVRYMEKYFQLQWNYKESLLNIEKDEFLLSDNFLIYFLSRFTSYFPFELK